MKKFVLPLAALSFSLALAQAPADTYVRAQFGEVDTLDPVQAYDTSSGAIIENIYETLETYAGESIDEFEPLLATDVEISEEGDVYTYTLREGVQFHSGNPMTCKDVEYSIERLLVTNPPDSGAFFTSVSLVGSESNANETLGEGATDQQYAEYWQTIDNSVECPDGPDGLTVRFNLAEPDPTFRAKLIYTNASVVDMQWAVENGMWDGTQETWRDWIGVDLREHYLHQNMSGTGAYELVRWTPGQELIAARHEGYWGEAPALANVVYRYIEEDATRILALQQGDVDRAEPSERAGLAQLRGAPGVSVLENPEWSSVVVGQIFFNFDINAENNPDIGSGQLDGQGIPPDFFSDINVRKCFAYSFDQEAFIEQVYEGAGQILTMGLPPSFPGYDDSIPYYTYDPEAQEEACRAAYDGQLWDTGFEFTATYNSGNNTRQTLLEIIKENIEFLNPNFRMNIRGISWPDFLDNSRDGKATLFALGWAPDYADPENFMDTFYRSDGYYSTRTNFGNEEMDRILREAQNTTDQDERAELYAQAGRLAYELAPMIPYPSPNPFMVVRSNLQGVYRNPMLSDQFFWKDISKN